ncbi:MAG: prolyl aminopeptidase [Proteobacteria bacterium]|nr:prolyl aminopeptidase [Pseudomonadota bacterium]
MRTPYAPTAPFASGMLDVGDGHRIAYFQYGNPNGKPAVYLHGGPGAGSSASTASLFNPEKYHIVLFDQRGCGKSTPHAELHANTTWDLVNDIEKLRQHLKIEKWLVCGGSWGSTLALAYAESQPQSVSQIILRGIFTLRREELLWFYQHGASWLFPDLWQHYLAPIPAAERGDMMSAYYRRLTGDDAAVRLQCARAWSRWEGATLSFAADPTREDEFNDADFALAFARIECHYFVHGGFFKYDGQLIAEAARLAEIPTVIVQGRYDVVTPMKTAYELAQALPQAEFIVVPDAGHAVSETGITSAIIVATDAFAAQ